MNVAIYPRVSTQIQVKEGISLDAQKDILVKFCIENNCKYEMFEEPAKSAKNTNRKKLREILDRLDEFDIVLVWKISRLARNVRDFANMLHDFEKNNVTFIAYSDNINTSEAGGKLLMYVLSIIAEIERDNTSENIKLAKEYSFIKGALTSTHILRI